MGYYTAVTSMRRLFRIEQNSEWEEQSTGWATIYGKEKEKQRKESAHTVVHQASGISGRVARDLVGLWPPGG